MKKVFVVFSLLFFSLWSLSSADVISGTVTDSSTNSPIAQVSVSVNTVPPASTLTDTGGKFSLSAITGTLHTLQQQQKQHIAWLPAKGEFSLEGFSRGVSIQVSDARGINVANYSSGKSTPGSMFSVANLPQGIYLAVVRAEGKTTTFKILNMKANAINQSQTIRSYSISQGASLSKAAGATYLLTFAKAGYATTTCIVTGSQSGLHVKLQPQADAGISFDPPAEHYLAETPVTITTSISGASIRYTTDGTTPTATNGTLYAGPVTMLKPINDDMTVDTVKNASGVTKLQAAAFKNGVQAGPVFIGIYNIDTPLRFPPSTPTTSLVLGPAHMAYNVSSQNWDSIFHTWTNYLGFDTVTTSPGFALIKINDQQYIELYQRPIVASQYQLANYGFYVSDAEAFRQQLATAGVKVPASCTVNALGNLSFFTTDPDGHLDEWVQYLPGSVTSKSLGQHMPSTQLFGFMNNYGDATADTVAATGFYSQFGFSGTSIGGTHPKSWLPYGNCYIELMTYQKFDQTQAGKHEKAQLITFRGMDAVTAANMVQARNPSIVQVRSSEGGIGGMPNHYCIDIYNADLSRIRMIDVCY